MTYGAGGGEAAGGRIGKILWDTIPPLFQSQRRSSASGSAPRDSTRQVRSSSLGSWEWDLELLGIHLGSGRAGPPGSWHKGSGSHFLWGCNSSRTCGPGAGTYFTQLLPRLGLFPPRCCSSPKIPIPLSFPVSFHRSSTAPRPRGQGGDNDYAQAPQKSSQLSAYPGECWEQLLPFPFPWMCIQ